jgi:hypothetical protein
MNKPRFQKGELVRIVHYISPLPRGSKVSVVEVNELKSGAKYLIEGEFKGETVRLWTKEKDLDLPYLD